MKKLVFFFLVFVTFILNAENYKKVKVFIESTKSYESISNIGIDLSDAYFNKDNSVNVYISDSEFLRLVNSGLQYSILIDNWNKYYENLPKLSSSQKEQIKQSSKEIYGVEGFGFGSMGGYYTNAEIISKLDSMRLLYPNLISAKNIVGYTVENRPIYSVKISDNPDVDEAEPEVFFNSLIHCREPAAMMAVMYYMYYLLENYGTNPEVTYLVNNREIYFLPVINVDGYEYNRTTDPNGGGMWRKNRKNYGGIYGVDLNRNFGYKWAYDNVGSSDYVGDETYRGPSAFSEPETEAFRQFVNSRTIKTCFNYHTYSNYLLYPWSYALVPTPDSSLFREFAMDITAFNGYEYGQPPEILYQVNGCTDDWMYGDVTGKPKIISFTPEIGNGNDGFWPEQYRIYPLAQENLKPNLYMTWVAGEYVSVNGVTYSTQYFNPGDQNTEMNVIFSNKGLSEASNVTAQLVSLNPEVSVVASSVNLNSIPARSQITSPVPFKFDIGNNLTAGTQVKLIVKSFTNDTQMTSDTLTIVIGTPVYVFLDNTNNISDFWNVTASPVNPQWETTTSTFYGSPSCYTDSKSGSYSSNATVTMITKDPIDLSTLNSPVLTFWTKFEIEDEWDCGKVQISTDNGATWTNLSGQYTTPASGKGTQIPTGAPIYDNVKQNWVKETINLISYTSSQIKLRFELKTDGSLTKDGWYLDDIGIFSYSVVPVELVSFSGSSLQNSVSLNWTTATELNNSGFEIQKSGDLHNWKTIGFLTGAGSSSEIHQYKFNDTYPISGINYYRLIQIDFNGSKNITPSIEVNFTKVSSYALEQNYPNPFNPSTIIKYQVAEKGNVKIKIFDVLGNQIAVLVNEVKESGSYNVEFNTANYPNLASGTYFYSINSGNFTAVKKLMLIK
ncbi:MAG: M14 family zinc carboxypeptidase [bacterium]